MIWCVAFSVSVWTMFIAYYADAPKTFIGAAVAAAVSVWWQFRHEFFS